MFSTGPGTQPDRLADALADGPFSRALTLAIDRSGLGLDRLRDRLAAAGAAVSTTTLSYWRTGRTVPARARSRVAVRILEGVLDLPPGSLTGLIERDPEPPPVPVVRWERLWGRRNAVLRVLNSFETAYRTSLVVVSLHEAVHVGPDRRLHRLEVREVVRATEDDTHIRLVTAHGVGPGCPPRLVRTRYCSPGRTETLAEEGFTVCELVLGRGLDRGETAIAQYEFEFTDDRPDWSYERRFRNAVHEHLLELHFAPGFEPRACHAYRLDSPAGPETTVAELPITEGLPTHVVSAAVTPGILGLRWQWDPP
ncbi:hypothetical protein [Amycolatopsis rubida]|uniref:Uncharacterized protein n=1 Tax=Amycolatopsis rubida TaxID=112413 RepID=A0A1I6B4N4_9PSEU|nr:hypothetical protein [Amycolatopsis rubida]SFQ75869.1 hypothetical protein SAMN05421854_12345 [Amycolatopsis rubida]